VLDLLYIYDHHEPLGAVIWAAVAKDPGYSQESLIAEIGSAMLDLDAGKPKP